MTATISTQEFSTLIRMKLNLPRIADDLIGRRADVALDEEWGDVKPRTQIVAIGAPGGIHRPTLTALFSGCIVETETV